MKIDPSIQATDLQNTQVGNAKSGGVKAADSNAASAKGLTAQDTVQFSGRHTAVAQLTSQLNGVPEIRVDRVSAFQSKLQRGTYAPDSAKVADAILAQQVQFSARA